MTDPEMSSPPFDEAAQLCSDLTSFSSGDATPLPGYPRVFLDDADQVALFLEAELYAEDLEKFAPHLWVLSTQSSKNVNRLHRQRVKGREIVVTEEARLHLVWVRDRIFIKPIPQFLMSHKFWVLFLNGDGIYGKILRESALGFLRTYSHLVGSESDFRVAQREDLQLIPSRVTWIGFCKFMASIESIRDDEVSLRYHYGELRLTRLNFWAPFILRKHSFEAIHTQYAEHFARLYAPFIFIFALLSILLNGMQVTLTAEQTHPQNWETFCLVGRWFGVVTIIVIGLVAIGFVLLWASMILNEWIFAIRHRHRKRRAARQTFKSDP